MYADAISTDLRGRGHDVVSVRETMPTLSGVPDDQVLAFAIAQGRVLVTENVRDYRQLEAELLAGSGHHHGIICTSNRQFPRGDPRTMGRLTRALEAILRDDLPMDDRSAFLRSV